MSMHPCARQKPFGTKIVCLLAGLAVLVGWNATASAQMTAETILGATC